MESALQERTKCKYRTLTVAKKHTEKTENDERC